MTVPTRWRGSSKGSRSILVAAAAVAALFLQFTLPVPCVRAEGILEVYGTAIRNDPAYASARFSYEAARESLTQAWSAFQPTIVAEGTHSQTLQRIISSDNPVYEPGYSSYPASEYSVSLVQPLFNKASLGRPFTGQGQGQGGGHGTASGASGSHRPRH